MPRFFETTTDYLLVANLLNSFFCIVMLVYVQSVLSAKTHSSSRLAFKRLVSWVTLCLLADMSSYLFDMHDTAWAATANHVSMFVSVLLTVYIGYTWNNLFDLLFHIKRTKKNRIINRLIWFIPTAVMFVLLIVNLFTGFLYVIDEHNVYHRGSWYIVSFMFQYVSFVHAIIRAMMIKSKVSNSPMKWERMRRAVIGFGCVVLMFGVLQGITRGKIAVHCLGLTAGVMVMFVRFLENQITQDRLTDLNNRYALDTYLNNRIKAYENVSRNGHHLYFLLMDVNGFKEINDHHGHLEGDNALRVLADVLRDIVLSSNKKLFAARYGGDEFAVVLEARDEHSVEGFIKQLNTVLAARTVDLPYDMSLCVGYSVYQGADQSIAEWIGEADTRLYEKKGSPAHAHKKSWIKAAK